MEERDGKATTREEESAGPQEEELPIFYVIFLLTLSFSLIGSLGLCFPVSSLQQRALCTVVPHNASCSPNSLQ